MPKSLFARLCLALIALLLTLFITIGLLLSFLDLNAIKPDLEQQLSARSNLEFRINGDLRWHFNWQPSLSFAIAAEQVDATILPVKESSRSAPPFIAAQRLKLGVNLSALMQRQLKITQLLVENVDVRLRTDGSGQHNWESIEMAVNDVEPTPKHQDSSAHHESLLSQFVLQELNVTSLTAHYDDELAGTSQKVSIDSLQLMELNNLAVPFPIKLRASVEQQSQNNASSISATAEINSNIIVSADTTATTITFQQLFGEIDIRDTKHPVKVKIQSDGQLTLSATNFAIESLALDKLRLETHDLSTNNRTAPASLDLTGQLTPATKHQGWLFKGAAIGDIPAAAELLQNMNAKPVSTSGSNSNSGDFTLTTDVDITINTSNNNQQFIIDKLSGNFNETEFHGKATLLLNENNPPHITSSLKLDVIDLSKYLNANPDIEKTNSSVEQPLTSTDAALPLDDLDRITTGISIDITKLHYKKLTLDKVKTVLNISDGNITMASLTGQLDDGRFDINSSLNRQTATPELIVNSVVKQLNVATVLNGIEEKNSDHTDKSLTEGIVDLTLSLTAKGKSEKGWRKTLSGNSKIQLSNGIVNNENVEYRVCQAVALARNTQLSNDWDNKTQLNTLHAKIVWQQGIGELTDLSGGLANVTITGNGEINMIAGDYTTDIDATIIGNIEQTDSACAINEKYRHVAWPIECRGQLLAAVNAPTSNAAIDRAPDCSVNSSRMRKIIREATKAEAKSKIQEKIEEKLGDKLDPELKDLIKGGLEGLFR